MGRRLTIILIALFLTFGFCFGQMTDTESQNLNDIKVAIDEMNDYVNLIYSDVSGINYNSYQLEYIYKIYDWLNSHGSANTFIEALEYFYGSYFYEYYQGGLLEDYVTKPLVDALSTLSFSYDNTISTNIFDFLTNDGQDNSLSEALSELAQQINTDNDSVLQNFFGTSGSMYSVINKVDNSINEIGENLDADLGVIIENQETQIELQDGIFTNTIHIVEKLNEADNQDMDYSYEGEQANSTSSALVGEATEIYNSATNQLRLINGQYELKDTTFDFSTFTNFQERVNVIKNDTDLYQILNQTNQLAVATQSLQSEINKQFQSLESFTKRQYESKIIWRAFVKEPIELNLRTYLKQKLDFKIIWDFVIWILSIFYCVKFLRMIWGENDNGE